MIRHDEAIPARSRRRIHYSYGVSDVSSKFRYPQGSMSCHLFYIVFNNKEHLDPLHVGKWIRSYYGSKSAVTAVFMTHAVINDNCSVSFCLHPRIGTNAQ
jgi:hypothetical protein